MSLAVLLPGRAYPVELPAIASVGDAVAAASYDVLTVACEGLDEPPADPAGFVVDRLLVTLAGREPDLVVGKSLSTHATPYAAERRWPAIWVTPLLRDASVVDGIRANTAPQLLVCGGDDSLHDPLVAAELGVEVLELPGLDHALSATGDGVVTPDTVALVGVATTAFLARLS